MNSNPRINRIAGLSVLAAMLSCYGTIALVAILALLGVTLAVHEGAVAGLISIFAVVAAGVILWSAARLRKFGPALLAVAGAGLILWAMWGHYNWLVELSGFVALIGSTFWDWRMRKDMCAVSIPRTTHI